MAKFDKTKPHGTIRGTFDELPEARYFQGGIYFDAQFNEIGGKATTPTVKAEEPKAEQGLSESSPMPDMIPDMPEVPTHESPAVGKAKLALKRAEAKFDANPNTANKTALTKAKNRLATLLGES